MASYDTSDIRKGLKIMMDTAPYVVVEFQFVEPTASDPNTDPYTGVKNQRFRVRVSIPYDNVRWTTLTLFNPNTLTAEVYWQCLVDERFTIDTSRPGWSP